MERTVAEHEHAHQDGGPERRDVRPGAGWCGQCGRKTSARNPHAARMNTHQERPVAEHGHAPGWRP
eukprot:1157510-Pelagomonas_calceolata.AAC.16